MSGAAKVDARAAFFASEHGMRKPIRPFAVETRRTGRKAPGASGKLPGLATFREEEAPKPQQVEWPPLRDEDDSGYLAAMRAADALFSRPAPEPVATETAAEPSSSVVATEPPRRILQSLNEDDLISRLLEEQEQARPKRGRKPRAPGEVKPLRVPLAAYAPVVAPQEPEPAVAACAHEAGGAIPGYVRGQIFARYARHSEARPGEQWRKRSLKPLW